MPTQHLNQANQEDQAPPLNRTTPSNPTTPEKKGGNPTNTTATRTPQWE